MPAIKEKSICQGLLCFGGSFNPIHNAHLQLCREVALSRDFGKVFLIPSSQPPHKIRQNDVASPTDRLAMCQIAVEDDPLFEVSDIELRREGPSYTYDTVMELKGMGYQGVHWLIGADMLMILPKWHRALELIREATILVMARPGVAIDWGRLPQAFQGLRANLVQASLLDVSATAIRRRIKAGESISGMVAPGVERYIREHGLYR